MSRDRFRLFLLAAVFCCSNLLEAAELVPVSSGPWRWFKGRTEASSPIEAWRALGFADGTWATATTPIHYGESIQGGTLVTDMQNSYSTLYLRRSFTVNDLAAIATATLDVKCDDGFAAWVNGQLVASANVPATLLFNGFAPAAATEPAQFASYNLGSPGTVLRQGENMLAVQVFNTSLGSSDIVFDAQLFTTEKETIAPTLIGITPFPGTVTNLTEVTVTFSEAVQGITASSLRINDIAADSVTGSGTTYTFKFAQPRFGTVQFSWSLDAVITDFAVPPNRFERTGANATFIFDLVDPSAPFVATTQPPRQATVRSLREISVMFSKIVEGVDATDMRVNGAVALAVSGLGAGPYVFTLPVLNEGELSVSWAAGHGIADENGKPFDGTGWNYALRAAEPLPRLRITELHALNENGLKDEDLSAEDWIEIYNAENFSVNLEGFSLTDDPTDPGRWVFPAVTVPANSYLVVFASAKDLVNGGRIHTNFKLGADGEYVGLFSPDAPRAKVSEVQFPEQRIDISYGLVGETEWRYHRVPTPGSLNPPSTITGTVEPVHFSVRRGFFSAPFDLTLHCPTPGAVVRYTLDGREPTATIGTNYTGPIRIDRTRMVRAAAFEQSRLPSKTETHTFLYNIPAIRSRLPVLSIVTASNHLYGTTGIMETNPRNTTKRGPAWERPVSVEFIKPADNEGFQIDCGIRLQGGDYIRGLYNYRSSSLPEGKYSFRLYFRGDYGAGKLDYPLIPGLPFQSFDEISLRAGMNDHTNPFIRDPFLRDLSAEVGIVASHGTFVHLYLNGVYEGMYNPSERIGPEFLQQWHGGGDKWDVIAQMNELVEGDMVVWNRLRSLASNQNPTNPVVYQQIETMLDIENFIDYLLPHIYGDTDDWPHNNWRAARERTPEGKFRFYSWDAEFSFGFNGVPVTHNTISGQLSNLSPPWGTTEMQRLFTRLKLSPEFRLHFADRVHKHLFNGGALTDERIRARYNLMKGEVASSISGFSDTIGTSWIPQRRRYVTNHLNQAGFLASSNAPVFSQFGGRVPHGYALSMSSGMGEIYYTTNGVDPRVRFEGTVSTQAVRYTEPIVINHSMLVQARTRWNQTNWSALTEMSFQVAQLGVPLRITELMYNPLGGDAFEYIELQNIGGVPLSLANFTLEGISYRFGMDEPLLAPGARVVLSSSADPGAFRQRYPNLIVRGTFSGSLANGGERIAVKDGSGNVITAVEYDDENGWPSASDGGGFSLELLNVSGDPAAAANWSASARAGGSPGEANSSGTRNEVGFNEVYASGHVTSTGSLAADWIELFNSGSAEVDLSGWSMTDGSDPRRFVFPVGTRIGAKGYLHIWCDTGSAGGLHAGFSLSQRGETLALFDRATNRIDALTFGLQITGQTLGRSEVNGEWTLTTPTPGAVNEAVNLSTNIVINEVFANPPAGAEDWFELHNLDTNAPAGIGGYYVLMSNTVSRLPELSFLSAGGYLQVWADENYGPDHVSFKLPASGGTVILADPLGAEINRFVYTPQREGISWGRMPNGTGTLRDFPFSASPGAENYLPAGAGLKINEVLAVARTGQAGTGRIAGWIEIANLHPEPISVAGHTLGLNGPEPGDWIFPDIQIAGNGQIVIWCDPSRPASNDPGSGFNTGRALNGQGGSVFLFDGVERIVDMIDFGAQVPDRSIQFFLLNGWLLSGSPTPGAPNSGAAELGDGTALRINEWMAEPLTGDDWIEIYNPQDLPVNLGGFGLTDDPSIYGRTNFLIAPLTFIGPKGHVLLQADAEREKGPEHVGFRLSGFGETIRLYNGITVVDEVLMLPQTVGTSEGRSPDGGANVVRFAGMATPRASNVVFGIDSDGDGLPDDWENANGLGSGDAGDAALDGDGDGFSNLAEFRAGTDPRNSQSVLRLTVAKDLDGAVRLIFNAAADRSYSILASDGLETPDWERVQNVDAGAARVVQIDDSESNTGATRFYRIVTPLVP